MSCEQVRLDYYSPTLAHDVEALTEAEINTLPFGAIHLGPDGVVLFYSDTERRQSGMKGRPVLGFDFFGQIAPCMDTPSLRGRVEQARKNGLVDIEIGWIGDFADRDRALTIRVLSASNGGLWLFNCRD